MSRANVYSWMHQNQVKRIRIRNSTAVMMRKEESAWVPFPLENNPIYDFLLLTDLILAQMGHEEFTVVYDTIPATKEPFYAMICVYSSDLGPAVAGLRIQDYEMESDMVEDAVMISRSIARKSAIADLDFGGAMIVLDHEKPQDFLFNRSVIFPFLEHLGIILEEYNGRIILSPDLNSCMENMHIIQRKTSHVICNVADSDSITVENGLEESGSRNGSGDPSPFTAFSVYSSLRAATDFVEGGRNVSLNGKKILIIGLGKVGLALIDLLVKDGAKLYGADIDSSTCQIMEELYPIEILARTREEIVNVHSFECFAIAPCATGGLISDKRIPFFRTKIICGAANHQLNQDKDAVLLHERGVLYIPDFVANCGGIINAIQEVSKDENGNLSYRLSYSEESAKEKIATMKLVTAKILEVSSQEGLSPYEVAVAQAHMKMQDQRKNRWLRYLGRMKNEA